MDKEAKRVNGDWRELVLKNRVEILVSVTLNNLYHLRR